jgi:two-component system nitrogen regulation response regulator GlnG
VKKQLEALVSEMVERGIPFDQARDEFEKKFIQTALSKTKGNQTRAAQVLGIHRNTLNRKIQQLKLNGFKRSGR